MVHPDGVARFAGIGVIDRGLFTSRPVRAGNHIKLCGGSSVEQAPIQTLILKA